jgi:hypothetical protein
MATSAEELICIVDRYIGGAEITDAMRYYRRNYIRAWFGPTDGQRCRS